ncbi:glycosyltransferase family 4 protein [Vulcanisaeta thermophila]|uniref:glycosyltransferase family 4 protein n=1 Tax=Vulcanisaeta thermophila TaxID=867917 RepID=UPI0008539CDC|nr:glycosyltransferase family 4 protein [Vulcanisaeta thermophila]
MIIVHTHHHYWPVIGGLENAIKYLAEEQVKLGHEVHVITSTYGATERPKDEEINGVHIHRIKATRLIYPDLTIPREIPNEILRKADIIHAWSHNSYFNYTILRNSRINNHVVYFIGVDYLKHHVNPLIRTIGYTYQVLITKKVKKITNKALTTNQYEHELLKQKYGIEATVIPHGIPKHYLENNENTAYVRSKYNIGNSKFILYVGRIDPLKGIDLLIRSYKSLISEGAIKDVKLVIAGTGNKKYYNKLIKLTKDLKLSENVIFTGFVSEEDKIALIDESEFVILPSKHAGESYPLILFETLARNKPLVATNVGSIPRLSMPHTIITEPSVKALKNTITNLLSNPEMIKEITRKARESKSQYLRTWSEIAILMTEIYRE